MFNHNIKFEPCKKCTGHATKGAPRQIFYLTDRVEVRCKNCGDVVVFRKKQKVVHKIERKIRRVQCPVKTLS